MIDIPTPTPFPTPVATTIFENTFDTAVFSQSIAIEAVQWWQQINYTGVFSLLQLVTLIILIIVGIMVIMRVLNAD